MYQQRAARPYPRETRGRRFAGNSGSPGRVNPVYWRLLRLQQLAGNRATGRLIRDLGGSNRATFSNSDVLQVSRVLSEPEIEKRGEEVETLGQTAPTVGVNLWLFTDDVGTNLYVLGTMHGKLLPKMAKGKALVNFLDATNFDEVYTEIADSSKVNVASIKDAFETLSKPEPPRTPNGPFVRDKQARNLATRTLEELSLDDAYAAIASKNRGSTGLEDKRVRDQVRAAYDAARGKNVGEHRYSGTEYEDVEKWVTSGNEAKLMELHSGYLRRGVDIQDIESRNDVWTTGVIPGSYHPGKTVIWIVGASHLAGIQVGLIKNTWKVKSEAL